MTERMVCPICNKRSGSWKKYARLFDCDTCGALSVDESLGTRLNSPGYSDWDLTTVQRAVLAHEKYLWEQSSASKSAIGIPYLFKIDEDMLARIKNSGRLPSRAIQASNFIRFVGDHVSKSGEVLHDLPDHIDTIIGAVNQQSASELAMELRDAGVFRFSPQFVIPAHISLSLEGWERYDAEQRGRFHGNYGFLAMKFDAELDDFINGVVKPTVEKENRLRITGPP